MSVSRRRVRTLLPGTSVLAAIALSVHRSRPRAPLAYLGTGRSPIRRLLPWIASADDPDKVAEVATGLAGRLAVLDLLAGRVDLLDLA